MRMNSIRTRALEKNSATITNHKAFYELHPDSIQAPGLLSGVIGANNGGENRQEKQRSLGVGRVGQKPGGNCLQQRLFGDKLVQFFIALKRGLGFAAQQS